MTSKTGLTKALEILHQGDTLVMWYAASGCG